MPGGVPFIDGNAVIDEPSANRAFHLVDAIVEGLAVLDQRAKLAMLLGRRMDGFEFVHAGHRCELEGRTVVLVLSATVLVLERGVMAALTFDHERLDIYRLSIDYVAFSY